MKWSHLPVAGGLYDQHPQFLEEVAIIFQVRSEYQERKRREDERKSRANGGGKVAGRRR